VISLLCSTVNAPSLTRACLQSLLACRDALAADGGVEFVLIDDHSDEQRATLPLLLSFRDAVGADAVTRVLRFRRRMHYTHALAYGLSLARGDRVLFISQDMVLTPSCVEEMLNIARDERIGAIRPTSQHMDWARALVQQPPAPLRTFDDVVQFSAQVRRQFAGETVDWPMLIGDAMLISRAVIDHIGVFDTRFYGFMGDIDYGIRLHRAGFRHVIARGAWLHHEGAGGAKESAATGGPTFDEYARRMLQEVDAAHELLRQKWGAQPLPPHFRQMKREHFERLHGLPQSPADAFVPPLDPAEVADFF
jgi:hypothetical protein